MAANGPKVGTSTQFKTTCAPVSQGWRHPADLMILFLYCINVYAPTSILIDAGVFRRLFASTSAISARCLSKDVPTLPIDANEDEAAKQEEFLTRVLRIACAMDFIDEADVLLYLANDMTHAFADPGFEAGFRQFFRISLGAKSTISELVSLAKNNAHRAPSTSTNGHT
jgi:hypothetical protein